MVKKCFYQNCQEPAMFVCSCTNEGVYFCANHQMNHLSAKAKHNFKLTSLYLEDNEKNNSVSSICNLFEMLKDDDASTILISKELINTIKLITKESLEKRKLIRTKYEKICNRIISDSNVDEDEYLKISQFD